MVLNKKTEITYSSNLHDLMEVVLSSFQVSAIFNKRDLMTYEGKTDGIQYSSTSDVTGIRKWIDSSSANEWVTFIQNTIDPSLILNINIVDINDI